MLDAAEKSEDGLEQQQANQLELDLGLCEKAARLRRRVVVWTVGALILGAAAAACLLLRG